MSDDRAAPPDEGALDARLKRWRNVERVFHAALECDGDAQRRSLIDTACAGDAGLRAEIESLLRSHSRASDFIEVPAVLPDETADAPAPDLSGTTLGHYLIGERVGEGGMGVVYRATDARLGRTVALKALSRRFIGDQERRQRLWREARAAAALSHPNIATIYAIEEFGDEVVLAAEFVRGRTLREMLAASGPLPVDRVASIGIEIGRALAAAHAQGIVHRDLKPENVMYAEDGRLKILDFGLAIVSAGPGGEQPRMTRSGMVLGTPAYMSPEQLRGKDVDARTDQYALGVLLFELATGRLPDDAGAPGDAALGGLRDVLRRSIDEDRSRRFPSMSAMVAAIEASTAAVQDPGTTSDRPSPAPLWWWQFHQLAASALYAAVLAMLWPARHALTGRWGPIAFCVALVAALVSIALRLHLWFTSRVYPSEWRAQRDRVARWMVSADLLFSAVLLVIAAASLDQHEGLAALLIAVAAGAIVASLVIEPATTRAAFSRE